MPATTLLECVTSQEFAELAIDQRRQRLLEFLQSVGNAAATWWSCGKGSKKDFTCPTARIIVGDASGELIDQISSRLRISPIRIGSNSGSVVCAESSNALLASPCFHTKRFSKSHFAGSCTDDDDENQDQNKQFETTFDDSMLGVVERPYEVWTELGIIGCCPSSFDFTAKLIDAAMRHIGLASTASSSATTFG